MIRNYLITLGYLCSATFAMAAPRGPDTSFLSDKAKARLAEVKNLHEQIREKAHANADGSVDKAWRDLGRSLHDSCMIGRGPGRGHGPHGQRPSEPPTDAPKEARTLPEDKKQEFETRLTSDACAQAIAQARGQLQ